MRKRGKKRIPQEIKPWFRVNDTISDENFSLPAKKTARWVSGSRRDWNTRVLNNANKVETANLIRLSMERNSIYGIENSTLNQKLFCGGLINSKTRSITKYKHFCLISGRGRTYNRKLYFARHNLRKLIGVGVISGLTK